MFKLPIWICVRTEQRWENSESCESDNSTGGSKLAPKPRQYTHERQDGRPNTMVESLSTGCVSGPRVSIANLAITNKCLSGSNAIRVAVVKQLSSGSAKRAGSAVGPRNQIVAREDI